MSVDADATKPKHAGADTKRVPLPGRSVPHDAVAMAAVGELTGNMAHDFNNLLTGIIGNIDMAMARLSQNQVAAAESYLQGARSAAGRAAGLTQRLLAFAQRQSLMPSPVPIAALLADFVDLLNSLVGPGIVVRSRCDRTIGNAYCDHGQLETALLTLAMNARDAMPDGGTLSIEAAPITRGPAIAGRAGDYILLTIADCGIGMSESCLARAFDPFFTTKPAGQGTGLGLSMVYGFVKQSGGDIELHSREGSGTTVRLFLPRHHDGSPIGP